jgi:hypothetical protein
MTDTTDPPAAIAPATDDPKPDKSYPKVKVSGFVQVFLKVRRARDGDVTTPDGTEPPVFRVQRARVKVHAKVTHHVDVQLELDPRAPEITGILRDAYVALDYLPHHELRIGQQKTQFGYENDESSTRLWFVNRSEVADNLMRGNVTLRDIGVGLIGDVPVGDGGWFVEDAVTVVNGAGANVQADTTPTKDAWGRVGARYEAEDWTVRAGFSGAAGDALEPADPGPPPADAFQFGFQRLGADVEVDTPWAWVAAEAAWGRDVVDGEADVSTGGYALVAVKTPWKVGPTARYDALADFHRVTVGAFYGLADDRLRVLANYEVFADEEGPHDDRFYLWTQARF